MNSSRLAIVAAIVVALCVAAVSAADPGAGSSGTQASSAQKRAKAKRGPQGPRGPRGPIGPAGPTGARGPQGAAGARGATGTLLTSLPSGQTLRGGFGGSQSVPASGNASADITFLVPLAFNPTVRIVQINTTPPAQCPGTATNPQAVAGNLCVFVGTANAIGTVSRYGMAGQNDFRFGVVVFAPSPSGGNADIAGTWAVTAP
jgi:hypothetical protein